MADFVLVPGAFMGAWSWSPVAAVLEERGHRVATLTVPGLRRGDHRDVTLDDAVRAVVSRIEDLELDDVHVVAHSWGGYPATGAAVRLPGRVAEVVYVSAVVPARGVGLAGETPQNTAFVEGAVAASADGAVRLDFASFAGGLMPGTPEAVQRLVFSLTAPMPGRYFLDALDAGPVTEKGIGARYLLSRGETPLSLVVPGEEFAARLGVDPVDLDGNHMYVLTHAEAIAAELDRGL